MLPEDHVVLYPDDVERIILIVLLQVHQDLELHARLMLKTLLVSYQLYRYLFLSLMIEALERLSEAALAKELNDLKAVGDLVLQDDLVVAALIVVTKVIGMQWRALDLLRAQSQEINLLIV